MNILSLRDCWGGPGPGVTQYRSREKGGGCPGAELSPSRGWELHGLCALNCLMGKIYLPSLELGRQSGSRRGRLNLWDRGWRQEGDLMPRGVTRAQTSAHGQEGTHGEHSWGQAWEPGQGTLECHLASPSEELYEEGVTVPISHRGSLPTYRSKRQSPHSTQTACPRYAKMMPQRHRKKTWKWGCFQKKKKEV